jgi:hypothetical protein
MQSSHQNSHRNLRRTIGRNALAFLLGAGALSLIQWYRRPIPPAFVADDLREDYRLLDRYLPQAEFSGEVSVPIHAAAETILAALQEVTLADMPIATWLGKLRYLPGRMTHPAAPQPAPEQEAENVPFLQQILTEGGNIILAEKPGREIVLGAIGKLHNLTDQRFVHLETAADFVGFNQPDYQKLAMSFHLIPLADHGGYHLVLTHRTHALSLAARWKFALYWIGIKPGGDLVSWLLLRAVKTLAERAPRDAVYGEKATPDVAFEKYP